VRLREFAPFFRPVRGLLAAGVAMSVLQAAMQWLAPWPLKVIFDSVLAHNHVPALFTWLPTGPSARLMALTVLTVAIGALLALFSHYSDRWVASAGQKLVFGLRTALFSHLQRQSLSFHHRRRTGDLMSRLDGDIAQLQSLMVDAVPIVINNVVTITGFVVIMLLVSVSLGLTMVAAVPVMFVLMWYYLGRIRAAQRVALRAQGEAAATAQEVLSSLPVVQAFGAEEREAERYGHATVTDLRAGMRALVLQSTFTPLVAFTMTVATAVIAYMGARAVLAGHLHPGDLIVFTAYLRGIYTPVRQLAKLAGTIGKGRAAAERVGEMLTTDESIREVPLPRRLNRAAGELEFRDVGYVLPTGQRILHGVNLEIPARTSLGLVGATGAGKSTLMRMVPRFVDPTEGAVLLDGADIRELSLADLRRQIAFVPQEPYVFQGRIWQNIIYGEPGMTRDHAEAAARAAGVHEVIASLPHGYETEVAERGASLSGGQRQCVVLARAMIRDAPILLLDEPTTGLDVELEALLLAALERVGEGRTTLMISHQLGAVRASDQIAVVGGGTVLQRDTHDDLLAPRRAFWRRAAA
jgi:ATP-binding cassette, subfamily B, bacterial